MQERIEFFQRREFVFPAVDDCNVEIWRRGGGFAEVVGGLPDVEAWEERRVGIRVRFWRSKYGSVLARMDRWIVEGDKG